MPEPIVDNDDNDDIDDVKPFEPETPKTAFGDMNDQIETDMNRFRASD